MNKKIKSVLILALTLVFCVCLFTACSTEKVDYFEYSDDTLGLVGKLVKAMHGWIGNYGWTVVVFTVCLKLVMLPLDFWQRYSSRKSTLKMKKIQPLLEEIDKRYGANTQRSNEEKQKLYKKQGYSVMSTCLPMIVSMVIFFVMFGGLRDYSTYSSIQSFKDLSDTYFTTCVSEFAKDEQLNASYTEHYNRLYDAEIADLTSKLGDGETLSDQTLATVASSKRIAAVNMVFQDFNSTMSQQIDEIKTEALESVKLRYTVTKQSWLWIQNVWQPDTWDSIMPEYEGGSNSFTTYIDMSNFPEGQGFNAKTLYNDIRNAVLETGTRGSEGKWNGLMVLPFMSIALSFLSIWISQKTENRNRTDANATPSEQNQQQAATNKTMMIMMPLMMAFFGFMYTGAFAIYMVVNYMLSILSTVLLAAPIEKSVIKYMTKLEAEEKSGKASYMR